MLHYLDLIDTHTRGPRCDVTPLFADFTAFSALIDDLGRQCDAIEFDCVAGIDALGFILGTALALRAHKGLVPIRKGGKLPVEVTTVEFVDYTGQKKSLELRADAIQPGARVLIADEWIETGAQARAAIELIERQGGGGAGIATINIDHNEQTRSLLAQYICCAVMHDE